MAKKSAGIIAYRKINKDVKVLLVHPGGPLWAKKDVGAWSIPKGEFDEEDGLVAAKREFAEETGVEVEGEAMALHPIRQKSGKMVYAWMIEMDLDAASIRSNTFEMEWPPRSGRRQSYPEVDRAEWFGIAEAMVRILPAQAPLLEEVRHILYG